MTVSLCFCDIFLLLLHYAACRYGNVALLNSQLLEMR